MSLAAKRATYLTWLRKEGTTITYYVETTAKGAHGVPVDTSGSAQVVPARVDEISREFAISPAMMMQVGDYTAHVVGDVDIPLKSRVIAKGKTCRAVMIRNDNQGTRNTVYLKVESQ